MNRIHEAGLREFSRWNPLTALRWRRISPIGSSSCLRRLTATIRSTRGNFEQPAFLLRRFAFLRILKSCLLPRKVNSLRIRRSIRPSARISRSRLETTPATAKRLQPRALPCAGWTRTKAGNGFRSAGKRFSGEHVSAPATVFSFRSLSGPFLGSGRHSRPALKSALIVFRAEGCRVRFGWN